MTNRVKRDEEKTEKYVQVHHPGYTVKQINVIVDVLGGESKTFGKQLAAVSRKRDRQTDRQTETKRKERDKDRAGEV